MQKITSKDNPNIKLYVKLAGGKKYRKENGLFTLEGVRLVEDAVKENAELHSVFVTESYVKKLAQQGEALNFPTALRCLKFLMKSEIKSPQPTAHRAFLQYVNALASLYFPIQCKRAEGISCSIQFRTRAILGQ